MRIRAPFAALLVLINPAFAQTEGGAQSSGPAAFVLSTGDVSQVELFMGKAMGKPRLRITYSPEKQAEFSKIAGENLEKKVNIVLNGRIVSDMLVTQSGMGKSLDVFLGAMDEATENEAFEIARALVNPTQNAEANLPAASPSPAGDSVSFSLSSDQNIGKVALFISRDHNELDVTFPSHDKIKEYAEVTKDNIGKTLRIILNGKVVKEETIKAPGWGHVVKVEMPSVEEAFQMAKALINPAPVASTNIHE
jgi:preprotein translocase subunit SecD